MKVIQPCPNCGGPVDSSFNGIPCCTDCWKIANAHCGRAVVATNAIIRMQVERIKVLLAEGKLKVEHDNASIIHSDRVHPGVHPLPGAEEDD